MTRAVSEQSFLLDSDCFPHLLLHYPFFHKDVFGDVLGATFGSTLWLTWQLVSVLGKSFVSSTHVFLCLHDLLFLGAKDIAFLPQTPFPS